MRREDFVKTAGLIMFVVLAGFLFCLGSAAGRDSEGSDEQVFEDGLTGSADSGSAGEDIFPEEDEHGDVSESSVKEDPDDGSAVLDGTIFVYVCGAVARPGVYEFRPGSRVYEAVDAAGGALEEAVPDSLNLADVMYDGQKIRVPFQGDETEVLQAASSEEESGEPGAAGGMQGSAGGLVNINTATVQELTMLPGIGQTRAAAVVAYRDRNGPFLCIEDLKNVSGIGEGIYSRVSALICVN